jgi:glycosyltransferase involved in cell wall biosynthesis
MAKKLKISLVATVLNEEKTITPLLDSITRQTLKPDEVIIVDGGSTDETKNILAQWPEKLKVLTKKGANRAEGRNRGVKVAKGEIIAFTDAGCILDENWLKELVAPFADKRVDIVAGYYRAKAKSIFEKCVVPYALVMPDQVDSQTFLPASRSMAVRKSFFEQIGGFPKEYSDNEDYVFALKAKKQKAKIVFARQAIVNWLPRENLRGFWTMIFRFARGDAQARVRGLKVASIFVRYLIFIPLFLASFFFKEVRTLFLITFGVYLSFSVLKNFRYVGHWQGLFWLPILQFVADGAVMLGTIEGILTNEKR